MKAVSLRIWALAAIVLLAGCTSEEPAPPEPEDNSTLGRVSGATVTPDIRPVGGVVVTMNPGNFETQSSLFGGFSFNNIPPGTYEITATHAEYDPASAIVVVVAGETAKPRLVMLRDVPPVPQNVTDTFPGFIPLSLGPADDASKDGQHQAGMGNCTCVFDVATRELMQTMVIEAVWSDSVEPAQPTRFRWTLTIDDNRTLSGAGSSPLLVHVQDADVGGWANATDLQVSLVPDEVWPAFEQRFTLFVTVFQVTPAPPGWSLVSGEA